ncbi:hypothetical protein [Achromobacter sp. 413638]|uniref:hypothetical protein n=1 Tax=Achromobacter sp. 413638 TaxID=3342385 RepID=UPI00370B50FC
MPQTGHPARRIQAYQLGGADGGDAQHAAVPHALRLARIQAQRRARRAVFGQARRIDEQAAAQADDVGAGPQQECPRGAAGQIQARRVRPGRGIGVHDHLLSMLTGYAGPAMRNSHTSRLSVPMQKLDFLAVMVYFGCICA